MEIPVTTSDLPFALDLTGVQQQNELVTGPTTLMLPSLENVEIDKTFWRVEQTSPMQSPLFEGNWVPQKLSYKQWTSALTGELLGVLERGTRLLVDRSPADRQAWFSIWERVIVRLFIAVSLSTSSLDTKDCFEYGVVVFEHVEWEHGIGN